MKSYLKRNRNHTAKQALYPIPDSMATKKKKKQNKSHQPLS